MDAVLEDVETAPISDAEKGLLRYVLKVNATPAAVSQADVDAAKALGWSDRALYDAATVCALFNFYNRWIDAAGVREMPEGFYEARLEAQGDMGYRM